MSHQWISFTSSLTEKDPPSHYPLLLRALWLDAKQDWAGAHDLVNDLTEPDAAWVHAYLHRVEGDLSNADYWYRRANRKRPDLSLMDERKMMVEFFLKNT